MNSFVSIFSSFYPNEKMQLLNFIDTCKKKTFTFPLNYNSIDILAYNFIYELYNYTLRNSEKYKYTLDIMKNDRKRRRGFYFDNPELAKYEAIKNIILDNRFIGIEKKKEFLLNFCKAQRIYFAFCKIARLFKIKHAKPSPSSSDMYLNNFNTLKPSILVNLYDDISRTNYTFRISDIINIINTSLSHSPNFFADPHYIKNPYTNIPFNKAQMYNLYFALKNSSYILPPLFHHFFLTNFTISTFLLKHECYIREEAIHNYLKNISEHSKVYYIKQMLLYHMLDMPNMHINTNVSDKQLLESFSHYIQDYLISLYSLQPEYKIEAYTRIKEGLYEFSINNKNFGRVIKIAKKRNNMNMTLPSANVPLTFNFSNPVVVSNTDVYETISDVDDTNRDIETTNIDFINPSVADTQTTNAIAVTNSESDSYMILVSYII